MSNRTTHRPKFSPQEPTGHQATALVASEFDQDRHRFLRRYLAFLRDPATSSDVKSDCVAGTISAIRQIARLKGVSCE